MANQFIYARINPIWMNEVKTFNPVYNTLPFDYQKGRIPYSQKVKFDVPTRLQVLSDSVPTLKIYQCETGVLKDTIAPTTPLTGIIGQTFTCYEFTINWGSYTADTYYIEITYNANELANFMASLKEAITPDFIDGNNITVINGNEVDLIFDGQSLNTDVPAGSAYSFTAQSLHASGAANPRLRLTVTKDNTVIFDGSLVCNGGNSLTYSGIAQPGSKYNAVVVTEDNPNVITPVNIADDNPVVPDNKTFRSGPIQSAENWPGTLVYEYTNSQNDFSVIWSTGIVMSMVVEGAIADYEPGFDDIIYEDQYHNTTKLNSIPYRQFTLYAGSATGFAGMPTYMGDKLNWIFACDQIKIDGVYYQNTNGSKWETSRTDPYGTNFMGLKIAIIEVNNLFLQSYQAKELPAGSIQVITRVKSFINISADISISGVFTAASVLTKIVIYNRGGDIFTLNAGTANDGSQPITNPFTSTGQLKEVWEINEPFDAAATLYIQGLAGTNCDIYVEYDQLDAPLVAPIQAAKTMVKGQVGMYEEVTVGDFAIDWNIGTGVGNPGGRYEGCVISGTNGTKDRNGLLAIGWDPTQPLTRDMLAGNPDNTIVQTSAQVGEHKHLMFNTDNQTSGGNDLNDQSYVKVQRNAGINRDYYFAKSNTYPTLGSTSTQNLGGAQPMDISNAARVTLFYVCITD